MGDCDKTIIIIIFVRGREGKVRSKMMDYLKMIAGTVIVGVVFLFVMGMVSIADGQNDTDCARFVAWVCGK